MASKSHGSYDASELKDGGWYQILQRYPYAVHIARYDAAEGRFMWIGSSETKFADLDEVDHVFYRLEDPPAGQGWIESTELAPVYR